MNPLNVLFPKARSEVIRLLFADPERSLHLRELARLSGLSIGSLQGEVRKLSDVGLLMEHRDGNRLYFRANRDHPLYPELRGISLKTTGLREQLAEALADLPGLELAFVYGSFASGDANALSDIDLFLVGSVGLRQVAPRLRPVTEVIGREINPYVIAGASFAEKIRAQDAFALNVLQSPKLWIIGHEHELEELAE